MITFKKIIKTAVVALLPIVLYLTISKLLQMVVVSALEMTFLAELSGFVGMWSFGVVALAALIISEGLEGAFGIIAQLVQNVFLWQYEAIRDIWS